MHVRKVRMTETGGTPTPHDFPLRFEFNQQMSGFSMVHPFPKVLTPLCELKVGKQLML